MFEAGKIDDAREELTGARRGSVAAAWAVAWSLLAAFVLFLPAAGTADPSGGRTQGISVNDRVHLLSLASRDGLRQTLSSDRKSGPTARLDPPVAFETASATVHHCRFVRITLRATGARLHAHDPAGYDCRGPPSSTT